MKGSRAKRLVAVCRGALVGISASLIGWSFDGASPPPTAPPPCAGTLKYYGESANPLHVAVDAAVDIGKQYSV